MDKKFWGSAVSAVAGGIIAGAAIVKFFDNPAPDIVQADPAAPNTEAIVVGMTKDGKFKINAVLADGKTVDLNDPQGAAVFNKLLDKAFDKFFDKMDSKIEDGKESQDAKDTNNSGPQEPQEKDAEAPTDKSAEKQAELVEMNKKLAKEAAEMHTLESWTKKELESSIFDKPIKIGIDSEIDKQLEKHKDKLASFQLSESQIGSIKGAIAQIVFEHFKKMGLDKGKTSQYVEGELVPKVQDLFSELNKIYNENSNYYKSMPEFMAAFEQYAGFHFYKDGEFIKEGLHDLLLTNKEDLTKLVQGFSEYAANESKIAELK